MQDDHCSIKAWIEESSRLRAQLAGLEEAVRAGKGIPEGARLAEIAQCKNHALAEYASLMEERLHTAEDMARQLNQRNEELQNSLAVLELYQTIFENEPAGIIGIDRQGRVIQFNSSAIRYFGVGLHALRLQQIGQLRLEGVVDDLQPDFAAMFSQVVDARSDASLRVPADLGRIYVRCYRLEDMGGLRGVVVRAIAEAVDGGASGIIPRAALALDE